MTQIQKPIPDAEIARIVRELSKYPQTEMPVEHHFAPGVYMREIFMPADNFVIGHIHKTEHLNIVLQGRAIVYSEGVTSEVVAPYIFKSGPGAQKVLYIQEDMRWATIHPTHETDLEVLEQMLIDKPTDAIQHEASELLGGSE